MEFDLIKRCMEYAKEIFTDKEITHNITTNATLLTPDKVEVLEKHKVSLMISLDGNREIHNKNRVFAYNNQGSYDAVIDNIKQIRKHFPEYYKRINFNVVVDQENDYLCSSEFFCGNENFYNSQIMSTLIDDRHAEKKLVFSDEFIQNEGYEMFRFYLYILGEGTADGISPLVSNSQRNMTLMADKIQPSNQLTKKAHHSGPCVPGYQKLFVNYAGVLYPCERISESTDEEIIGTLDDGFYLERVDNLLNIGRKSEDACKNCWQIRHCRLCMAACENAGLLDTKMKMTKCRSQQYSIANDFSDYTILKHLGVNFNNIQKVKALMQEEVR